LIKVLEMIYYYWLIYGGAQDELKTEFLDKIYYNN
jgi:hypothetical protein